MTRDQCPILGMATRLARAEKSFFMLTHSRFASIDINCNEKKQFAPATQVEKLEIKGPQEGPELRLAQTRHPCPPVLLSGRQPTARSFGGDQNTNRIPWMNTSGGKLMK